MHQQGSARNLLRSNVYLNDREILGVNTVAFANVVDIAAFRRNPTKFGSDVASRLTLKMMKADPVGLIVVNTALGVQKSSEWPIQVPVLATANLTGDT